MTTGRTIRVRTRSAAKPASKIAARPAVPDEAVCLLALIAKARFEMNASARRLARATKDLEAMLDKAGLNVARTVTEIDGRMAKVIAEKVAGMSSYIDLKKLQKRTSPSVFMQCVVAQKGLVERFAGKAMREAVEVTETTDPAWKVTTEFVEEGK